MPFNSEHTTACKISIVHGELRRYIKRSLARNAFIDLAGMLRQRLHLRGFPFWFLAMAFASAPWYEQRSDLLAIKQKSDADMPAIVFATTYSRQLLNSGLSRAIFSHRHYLGKRWNSVKFITAWEAGQKLGNSLIAFKYPKPIRKSDSTFKSSTEGTSTSSTARGTAGDTHSLPQQNSSTTVTAVDSQPAAIAQSASDQAETSDPSHSDDRATPGLPLGQSTV